MSAEPLRQHLTSVQTPTWIRFNCCCKFEGATFLAAWPTVARPYSSFRSGKSWKHLVVDRVGTGSTGSCTYVRNSLFKSIRDNSFSRMNIRRAVVLGGVSKGPDINALKRGVHVPSAMPGCFLDHVYMRSCLTSGAQTPTIRCSDRDMSTTGLPYQEDRWPSHGSVWMRLFSGETNADGKPAVR